MVFVNVVVRRDAWMHRIEEKKNNEWLLIFLLSKRNNGFFSVSEPFPLASILFKTIYLFTLPPPAHPPSLSSSFPLSNHSTRKRLVCAANIHAYITTLEHEWTLRFDKSHKNVKFLNQMNDINHKQNLMHTNIITMHAIHNVCNGWRM